MYFSSNTVDLPGANTFPVELILSVPTTDEVVVLINKNIVFPAAMTVATSRIESSQEFFRISNTGETIHHIHKYRFKETRMRRWRLNGVQQFSMEMRGPLPCLAIRPEQFCVQVYLCKLTSLYLILSFLYRSLPM